MELSRRNLLIGTATGGGLLVGWALLPRQFDPPMTAGPGEFAFDAWLRIGRDGIVTVAVPQLEMGQGITTLLPQLAALELGADWRQMAVEPALPSGAYANVPLAARWSSLWMPLAPGLAAAPDATLAWRYAEDNRFAATAEGLSLAAYEMPVRVAAASARAMLCMAASARWGAGWEECETAAGFVTLGKKRLSFAQLAEAAAGYDPPDPPVLRPAAPAEATGEFPPGAPPRFPRLDLPSKVDGSHVFAGDVRLPGMAYAAIRHGPLGDAELSGYEAERAQGLSGNIRLIHSKRWLAALADTWWEAERALAAIAPRFKVKKPLESHRIAEALEEALLYGEGERLAERGEPDRWVHLDLTLAKRYEAAPALHATVETASATARYVDGRLELWLASQAPEAARQAAAGALGISLSKVELYPMPAGGSFDRRLEHDHAIEAAVLAREAGRPVQLTWSRWQEHLAGWPRPPVSAVMAARTAPTGETIAWKARIAVPAAANEFGRRLFGGETPWSAIENSAGEADPLAVEGAIPPYAVPHLIVEHVPVTTGLPAGRMRGNAHGYTAFFTESFVDELAHLARQEPLAYRMAMLGDEPRLAACLQRVSSLAEWGGGIPGSGQGIACHRMEVAGRQGYIAAVATARRAERGIKVDRIVAVLDIGRVINTDIARQQVEGGLIFGLGLALGSATGYAKGLPQAGRLGALGLPLLADSPEIEMEFIDSSAEPFDPGELGVAVAAPAIANALYSATGNRIRRLPLTGGDA